MCVRQFGWGNVCASGRVGCGDASYFGVGYSSRGPCDPNQDGRCVPSGVVSILKCIYRGSQSRLIWYPISVFRSKMKWLFLIL